MRAQKSKWLVMSLSALLFAACAFGPQSEVQAADSKAAPVDKKLAKELENPTRPQADRDRDANRKPAQLLPFFGVKPKMTVVDIIAGGGYMTEVLSVAVGPKGKVYSQNQNANKTLTERVANNHLPNVVLIEGEIAKIPPGTADVAITAMNLHDIYNGTAPELQTKVLRAVFGVLKPGGIFGVVDHVGVAGADNSKLHRMTKEQAIEVVKSVGFELVAESDVLANPADDHTKGVFDPTLRGKTDQFTLKFKKPK
jgi:predicted methyltransferase